tara:strand:- start:422 stop:820 length:399 start_codon:yes stop_codon:yes gene_type:complete
MSTFIVDNIKGKTTANTMTVLAGHATDSTTTTNLEQGLTKSWVHLDASSGTPIVQDSFNVSSLGDQSTGQHTVNINNDFNNANYANTVNSNFDGFFWVATGYTTEAYTIYIYTGSGYSDRTEVIGKSCGDLA